MRSIITSLFLLFTATLAFGQLPKWATYINDNYMYDIALEGDIAWVGSQGGLTKINRLTGEKESFLPTTINLGGFGVMEIEIAADGTKWIGGHNGGLFRFDGINWERYYYINTGDTLVEVSKIRVAPNGDVWFRSTINGNCGGCPKFFKFDGSNFTRMDDVFGGIHIPSDLGSVRDFDIAPNGDVWAYTVQELYHYTGQGQPVVFTPADIGMLPDNEYMGMVLAHDDGTIYLTTNQSSPASNSKSRIYKYDGTSWSVVPIMGNSYWLGYISHWFTDTQHNIWMNLSTPSSDDRVVKFNGADWQIWSLADLTFLPTSVYSIYLRAVDEVGRWWAFCYQTPDIHQDKVFEIDGTSWKSFSTEFYPMDGVYGADVEFDCNNNVWVCGYGFLNRFDGVNWVGFTDADINTSISDLYLYDLEVDRVNCNIWMANLSSDGSGNYPLIVKYDGSEFQLFSIPNCYGITNLEIAEDGTVWVASSGKGVGHLEGTSFIWYDSSNSPLSDNYPNSIALDNEGAVWVTDDLSPKVYRFLNGNWTTYTVPLQSPVYWMYFDNSGILWMGNARQKPVGFDGLNWTIFSNAPITAYNIAQDAAGNYWFGGTIAHYDGNSLEYYGVENYPIGENYAYSLKVDPFNNKWFVHNAGISVYNEDGINFRSLTPRFGVKGKVYYDADQDGTLAADGEPGLPGLPVTLLPENITTYSSFGGHYKLFPETGNHQISFQPPAPYVPTSTNPLDLLMGSADQTGFDIGTWRPTPPDSIGLDLTLGLARCSETTNVWVTPSNLAPTTMVDGTVKLAYEPSLQFVSAIPAPISDQGHQLTWDVEGLEPYQPISIKAIFQNPNADHVGEWMDFTANFTADGSGLNVSQSDATELRCSYDPNDKQATPTGESVNEYSLLGDALDYTIRFQNKGNDTAFIVVIRDTLDADLDPASFQLVSSSHPVRVVLEQGRKLTFFFENINLLWEATDEPASHGFVKYRIAPNPSLPDPTEIHNTAHIYFDLNPAIVTNTTQNILVETLPFLSTDEPLPSGNLLVYPNPTSRHFWVEPVSMEGPWSASIHDVYGRTVKAFSSHVPKVKVEGLNKGFYFIRVEQGGKMYTAKVVVE